MQKSKLFKMSGGRISITRAVKPRQPQRGITIVKYIIVPKSRDVTNKKKGDETGARCQITTRLESHDYRFKYGMPQSPVKQSL